MPEPDSEPPCPCATTAMTATVITAIEQASGSSRHVAQPDKVRARIDEAASFFTAHLLECLNEYREAYGWFIFIVIWTISSDGDHSIS